MRYRNLALLFLGMGAAACSDTHVIKIDDPANAKDALTTGWQVRHDTSTPNAKDGPPRFQQYPDGLLVTPGPNCSLWHDDHAAAGDFRLTLDVSHLESGMHPHGAGLTFGGSDVHGDGQRYTYFLVRGDQKFLIKSRNGTETAEVVNWTEHGAIAPEDGNYQTRNVLAVERSGEMVRFLINGEQVHSCDAAKITTDGRYGIRLVHDLRVRFEGPVLERK